MSRKRKPLVQLGGGSSKLHKYGYSKQFHTEDSKGAKNTLSILADNYSDSDEDDGDNSQADTIEEVSAIIDQQQSCDGSTHANNDVPMQEINKESQGNSENLDGSLDMDDKLKNFLSEIEAIPIPSEPVNDSAAVIKSENILESNKAADCDGASSIKKEIDGDIKKEIEDDNVDGEAISTVTSSKKPMYSMFVKGESEFVRSPSPVKEEVEGNMSQVPEIADIDLPEEPTSAWQLVQDETSQYYYYWNTITNEVTWEIPAEYTQFLLRHKEFSDKLARLPEHKQKLYNERKAKLSQENSAQTISSTPHQSSSTTAISSSSSSNHQSRKQHKDKKRRSHKKHNRIGDNNDDRPENVSPTNVEYGPVLPEGFQLPNSPSASEALTSNEVKTGTFSSSSTSGSQLLSIVPYLSDDEDEEDDDKERSSEPDIRTTIGIASTTEESNLTQESGEKKTEEDDRIDISVADSENVIDGTKGEIESVTLLDTALDETKALPDSLSPTANGVDISENEKLVETQTEINLTKAEEIPPAKKIKISKEVIDMFADDSTVASSDAKEISDLSHLSCNTSDDIKALKGEGKQVSTVIEKDLDNNDDVLSKNDKEKEICIGYSSPTNDPQNSCVSDIQDGEDKSKRESCGATLVGIADYASEDSAVEDNQFKSAQNKTDSSQSKKMNLKGEKVEPEIPSLSSHSSKKRKKEKKKHKRDEGKKVLSEKGAEDVSLPDFTSHDVGQDILAKVTETLDKEISDIVIQTISQNDMPFELREKTNCSLTTLSNDQSSKRDESKVLSINSSSESCAANQETQKNRNLAIETENNAKKKKKKKKVTDVSRDLEKVMADNDSKPINKNETVEPVTANCTKDESIVKKDDNDDIDFEDLDDIDRALEVALEKKRVELAKCETKESKPETDESVPPLSGELASGTKTLLEKEDVERQLKEEVRTSAELALSKLEFLDISTENLSRLQVLFVELQTRLHDWEAGGLSSQYFHSQLQVAEGLLEQYELSAVPSGWACQWDRSNNRYYYRNLGTGHVQWEYPQEEAPAAKTKNEASQKSEQRDEKDHHADIKSSSSRSKPEKRKEKSEEEEEEEGAIEEHRESAKKRSSKHRKRDDKKKDRGSSRHHKRKEEESSSSHRYRRKHRRRKDPSSSSSSSSSSDSDSHRKSNETVGRVSSNSRSNGAGSKKKRHHRHHNDKSHHNDKKKKRRRRHSRSQSVEIVDSDVEEKGSLDVQLLDGSPIQTSPTPETSADLSHVPPEPPLPIMSNPAQIATDIGIDDEVDSESLKSPDKTATNTTGKVEDNHLEDVEMVDSNDTVGGNIDDDKKDEKKEENKAELTKAPVIYKPPQIVVPLHAEADVKEPILYGAPIVQPATCHTTTVAEGVAISSHDPTQGEHGSAEAGEDSDKLGKKKKKEKKSSGGSSLMMKKKQMSSMVQKWQKVKKEVEKEDRAKELKQAAIRKKIEELKQQ